MRFQLTDYQEEATAEILVALQEGSNRYEKHGKLTAVALSAPTAAGKTVIATAVIERFLFGDADRPPNPAFTVLWVTDDPSLNQQTKRKMLLSSSLIQPNQLITVDPSLDQETLHPGKVYFVHIQQLGRGATNYIRTGDRRQYSLWDTIARTIVDRRTNFLLVVDEAHKGTAARSDGAKTITAQLVDGASGHFPASPLVLGITATPDRFREAIGRAGTRVFEPICVDAESVRESGLIKDKVLVKHPHELKPADSTLLELALSDLAEYEELWKTYAVSQSEPIVRPILVVQVRPMVSRSELADMLDTVAAAWKGLDERNIAHSFQDHSTIRCGSIGIRYVAPHDIQDDPLLRIVFFKEALTTGWDCPRAEVMLSLRSAEDYTYIAQLIGRMVRTPLARRIVSNQVLNTVSLYLPYYDAANVSRVVKGLESTEDRVVSRIETDSVRCIRNAAVPPGVWSLLEGVPSYTRPVKYHRSEVSRLSALAMLLSGHAIHENATDRARQHVVDSLRASADKAESTITQRLSDLDKLVLSTQAVDLATQSVETQSEQVSLSVRNIDDLFDRARRNFTDAAASWYWNFLCEDGVGAEEAKLRVIALSEVDEARQFLEDSSRSLINQWQSQYGSAVNKLPDAKRASFWNIWRQTKLPQQVTLVIPTEITTSDGPARLPHHLFIHGKGTFPSRFASGWEAEVIARIVARGKKGLWWYQNPDAGESALGVPYEESGIAKTMYPDFLVAERVGGTFVLDLVDPHRPDLSDTGPKWRGLAAYAAKHESVFRRVLIIIKNQRGALVAADLTKQSVREAIAAVHNETDVLNLFANFGVDFA